MKKSIFVFSLFVIVLLFACNSGSKKITIGYVQITQDPVLDVAIEGVFRALNDSGFVNGENIKVLDNNAQGDFSMINMILQSFQSQNVDLIVTNSTPCMIAAAQIIRNTPIVFTVATGPEQVGLKSIPDNLFGVYDLLRADEFVGLILDCIPNLRRIGIPYNNAEPNAVYSVEVLSKAFSDRGITLITASVTSSNDIFQAGQYLVGQRIDALVAAADNTVYLGLQVLSKLASEQKIPLFVSDPLQAEKGAAIGFGANYDLWGYQSGIKAVDILRGRASTSNRIERVTKYDLTINRKACTEQGLAVPEKVLNKATHIIN